MSPDESLPLGRDCWQALTLATPPRGTQGSYEWFEAINVSSYSPLVFRPRRPVRRHPPSPCARWRLTTPPSRPEASWPPPCWFCSAAPWRRTSAGECTSPLPQYRKTDSGEGAAPSCLGWRRARVAGQPKAWPSRGLPCIVAGCAGRAPSLGEGLELRREVRRARAYATYRSAAGSAKPGTSARATAASCG